MAEIFDLVEQKFFRCLNTAMKFFIVEYCLKDDTTSIRTFEAVLRDNFKKICRGEPKIYLPVGVFKTHDEALAWSLHFQTVIAPQAQLESGSRNWKQIGDVFENELNRLLRSAEPYADSMPNSEK